jgi:D-erythronate 2-dehydrogenase
MRILITGAGGFLGRRLARALAARAGGDGAAGAPLELVLADRALGPLPPDPHGRLRPLTGDLADPAFVDALAREEFDVLFHLAATLTLEAERDAERAYTVNVAPLRRLIAAPRRPAPRVVFTSSIAVFGGALPEVVDDAVRAAPTTTYGAHKAVLELLLADATRRGLIDGRALRLPIVVTRPGASSPAVSDRVAALLREPLAGRSVASPFRPDTRLCLASAGAAVRALLALSDLPADALPAHRAMNLPALSATVAEMVAAVAAWPSGGAVPRGTVTYAPDPALQAVVDGWPRRFVSATARRLGLEADADLPALIADHVHDPEAAPAGPSPPDARRG